MINILCTSCGNESFPEVIESLRKNDFFVIGVDSDKYSAGLWKATKAYVVPPRSNSVALLGRLREIIEYEDIQIVLPLSTCDQYFYSSIDLADKLAPAIIAVSSHSSISIASDKIETYRHLVGKVPLPNFEVSFTAQEAVMNIRKYADAGQWCVLKRPFGTGSQGVKIIAPGARSYYEIWQINNTTVYSDDICSELVRQNVDDKLMVTEFLQGRHISVDCFRATCGRFHGLCREEFSRGYGIGIRGQTVYSKEAIDIARIIAETLDLSYAFNVELKEDASGQLRLLEVNPRMGASVGVSIRSGLNVPLMQVLHALDQEIPEPSGEGTLIETRRTTSRLYNRIDFGE